MRILANTLVVMSILSGCSSDSTAMPILKASRLHPPVAEATT